MWASALRAGRASLPRSSQNHPYPQAPRLSSAAPALQWWQAGPGWPRGAWQWQQRRNWSESSCWPRPWVCPGRPLQALAWRTGWGWGWGVLDACWAGPPDDFMGQSFQVCTAPHRNAGRSGSGDLEHGPSCPGAGVLGSRGAAPGPFLAFPPPSPTGPILSSQLLSD